MSKLTLWGIEHYLQAQNKSVFDNLNVPTGMDKATLTDGIMLDGGEFGVVYSDADFLREAIGKWSSKNASTFERWWEVWNKTYNPLYNFDRTEVTSDNETSLNRSVGQNQNNETGLQQVSNASNTSSTTDELVSAYDETTDFSPKNRNITGTDNTNRTNGNVVNKIKANNDETFLNTKGNSHKGRLYGNIGVTQTTELLANEQEFRKEYNPYKMITDLFVVDFLIGIY